MNRIISTVVYALLEGVHRWVPDGMKVYFLSLIGIALGIALLAFGDYSLGGYTLWISALALAGRNSIEKLSSDIKATADATESGVGYSNNGWR